MSLSFIRRAEAPSYRMGHAVVIGASLAGLLAATVLSKHFDHVTVLEREAEMRHPVSPLVNVRIVTGASVTRYAADWEYSRLTGVFVRSRGFEMPEDLLRADLVVDASGRSSQTPRFLRDLGYDPPPESSRRHYERLKRFPTGLLVMGDALCSSIPVDGGGMTVSALEAALLDECLSRLQSHGTLGIECLTRDFRRRVAKVVRG